MIQTNKVGVWSDPVEISGPDFIRPIMEIKDLATNDAASLSLTLYGSSWLPHHLHTLQSMWSDQLRSCRRLTSSPSTALLAIDPSGAPRSLRATETTSFNTDASRFATVYDLDDSSSDTASTIVGVPAMKSEKASLAATGSDLEGQHQKVSEKKKLGVWARIKRALGF
jgi:hypothetical protein